MQDANNLAWKLAAVVQGAADESLLDTYEIERKPKATSTVKIASYNTLNTQAVIAATLIAEGDNLREGHISSTGREVLSDAVTGSGDVGTFHLGYQLGTIYSSSAIVSDGTVPAQSTIHNDVETASPGARSPHLWLTDKEGKQLSLRDLQRGAFVLLTNPLGEAHWSRTAAEVSADLSIDIDVVAIGSGAAYDTHDEKWRSVYALSSGGAALLRPDSVIGARFIEAPADPSTALDKALRAILARTSSSRGSGI